jgi:hypothetical protein
MASANGCTTKSNVLNVNVLAPTDPACTTAIGENSFYCQVYPNPFTGSFQLETGNVGNGPVTAELFNAAGALVNSTVVEPFSGKTKIAVATPGFYTLRVKNSAGVKIFKLISN